MQSRLFEYQTEVGVKRTYLIFPISFSESLDSQDVTSVTDALTSRLIEPRHPDTISDGTAPDSWHASDVAGYERSSSEPFDDLKEKQVCVALSTTLCLIEF